MSKKEKIELLGQTTVSAQHIGAIRAELERRKGFFRKDFLDRKRAELGYKKFEQQRAKLAEEAAKCWELAEEGKRRFHELEERSHVKIMEWAELEKSLRQWLENQALGEEWSKEMIEKTIIARRNDFERAQRGSNS